MTLPELIQAIEQAAEGSREMDAAIADATGWKCIGAYGHAFKKLVAVPPDKEGKRGRGVRTIPHFTTSLAAAVSLVPERWSLSQLDRCGIWGRETPQKWSAEVHRVGEVMTNGDKEGWRQTAPTAICAAALRAIAAERGES